MLTEVNMIIFAIHAALKVGQKIRTVYEEEVRDRPLLLPPVGFTDANLVKWDPTKKFFEGDGKGFVALPPQPQPGEESRPQASVGMLAESRPQPTEGMLYKLWQDRDIYENKIELRKAYQYIKDNIIPARKENDVKGDYRRGNDAGKNFYEGANALFVVQQWRDADPKKPRPVWQRLAGTVVELAVDYVQADPSLFGGNGKGDRIVRSFLLSLDEVKFAESRYDYLLLDIMRASLNTFSGQAELVLGDDTLALLLKRVSTTLVAEVNRAEQTPDNANKLLALYNFRREMLQDILRVSADTVSTQATRLLGQPDTKEKQFLDAVLQAA